MRYYVRCYSAPYESTQTDDLDRAVRLCDELCEEHGHTDVIDVSGKFNRIAYSNC